MVILLILMHDPRKLHYVPQYHHLPFGIGRALRRAGLCSGYRNSCRIIHPIHIDFLDFDTLIQTSNVCLSMLTVVP